jgi:hypothetical protein
MIYTEISTRKPYPGKVVNSSGEYDASGIAGNLVRGTGAWCTKKHNAITTDHATIDYGDVLPVNFIEIAPSAAGLEVFPEAFRLEGSQDGETWKVLHHEKSFDITQFEKFRLDLPITFIRYLKLLVLRQRNVNKKYYSEIGSLAAGISGFNSLTATSSSSYQHDVSQLVSVAKDTYWESEVRSDQARDKIDIDLGNIFHINKITLASAPLDDHGFPEHFFFEVSTDLNIWTAILEEKNFAAEPSRKYFWEIEATPARFLRIDVGTPRLGDGKYAARIASLEISAAYVNPYHTHNIGDITPYASVFGAGIVRLAKDGEDAMGTAVQGNDHRLRDASTIFKGITRLAIHGEIQEGLAVQASDPRIQPATEVREGIVRLAYDREDNPGAAVQGNDSRLQEATINGYGIVKLCPDNVYSENSVVTGNDPRIRRATVNDFGICRLADNGEISAESAVQGNDRRLRDATTLYRGIVELAEDGEDEAGVAVQGNDRRLKPATTTSRGIVELAEDGEDRPGAAVQGSDRRLRDATTKAKGIVELAEDGEDRGGVAVQGNDRRLRDAVTTAKGIVELAEDGEDREGVAVQGNDRRLKDATDMTKGIVRFARDGEAAPQAAVQSSDRRLRDATTSYKGIVELAEDGESGSGVAVQGSDRRLKEATTSTKGIVELAEDGEEKTGVAVQGSDRRLKEAGEGNHGIVRFARDNESSPLAAVQANDRRLRDATTTSKGIVELAEDGEDREGAVVQGNDRRLREATATSKGIVELAEDGEDRAGVVVQGNDRRLRNAGTESPGIVRLAKNGEQREGMAVQANDARLADAREPLAHAHDYAPLNHGYGSHSGTISVIAEKEDPFSGILPPPDDSSVIYGRNESKKRGAAGVIGVSSSFSDEKKIQQYGIMGHSQFIGVRGQSAGNEEGDNRGCGVLGISRFGAGGVFASEHGFSLVADGFGKIDGFDDSAKLTGNGQALQVTGRSEFHGRIDIDNGDGGAGFPAGMAELFEVDDEEYIAPGDLLVASPRGGGVLSRSRAGYDRGVIGIVSGNPTLVFNNGGEGKKMYPVALAGRALCKVDARERPVKPGDLIVTSNMPGCGMAGDIDSPAKTGTVIAKALDGMQEGIGTITVFIVHA